MLASSLQSFITDPRNLNLKHLLDKIKKLHPEICINFDVKIFNYDKNLSQKDMGILDGEIIGMVDDGDDEYADEWPDVV